MWQARTTPTKWCRQLASGELLAELLEMFEFMYHSSLRFSSSLQFIIQDVVPRQLDWLIDSVSCSRFSEEGGRGEIHYVLRGECVEDVMKSRSVSRDVSSGKTETIRRIDPSVLKICSDPDEIGHVLVSWCIVEGICVKNAGSMLV
ncbi:hypothetical protein pipiens_008087 [Culex pipiens pipiens]|uniref:Uncharacterized protein n=1 Tax=Culex pipiens pipiens TaxID=38569 RepID=A0ABD1DIM1_CULPP